MKQLTAIITPEDDGFVALCPELDIASQGESVTAARANLQEAVELWLEVADDAEVQARMAHEPIAAVVPLTVNVPARMAA